MDARVEHGHDEVDMHHPEYVGLWESLFPQLARSRWSLFFSSSLHSSCHGSTVVSMPER